MVLVTLLQTSKDRDGRQFIRLINHHSLETALKGLVFLEVFLILVQRGGTDGTQFTTGEGWLKDIGSIHRSLTTAGSYECVDLVDEEYDSSLGLCHLVDDALQTLLKLTLVFRTGNEGTHIE